ncbi:MAG: hypothetical protein WCW04_01625 [Candidatus Paceibacterota bacterium]
MIIKELFNQVRDFLGENNELVESTNIAIKERMISPFYGYFICSWFLFNWKIFYVAFFVSQDNIISQTGLLRHQYLQKIFPILGSLDFWCYFVIYPFVSTIIFFWIFPYITRVYYRKSLKNEKALKKIQIQESIEIKKEEKKLIQEETRIIDENIRKAKQEKRAQTETPEILWENEFANFRRSSLFRKFDHILDSIYKYAGLIRVKGNFYGQYEFELERDILIFADSNDLIKINGDSILFTDKGKFFAKRYSQIKGGVIVTTNTAQA